MAKKPTNRIYQIYDLRDSIKSAVENIEKLIASQELLVKCIKESPVKDKSLDEFVKGVEAGIKDYKAKLPALKERYEKAKALTDLHEQQSKESETSDRAVTLAIEAMALDQPEPDEAN